MARTLGPYRVMPEKIGVTLELVVRNYAAGRKMILDHAFDLTTVGWFPEDPPGASEHLYWHSTQAVSGGYGLAGLQSPITDRLIDVLNNSTDPHQIVSATQMFDRFLSKNHFVVRLWHDMNVRFVHDAELGFPTDGLVPEVVAER